MGTVTVDGGSSAGAWLRRAARGSVVAAGLALWCLAPLSPVPTGIGPWDVGVAHAHTGKGKDGKPHPHGTVKPDAGASSEFVAPESAASEPSTPVEGEFPAGASGKVSVPEGGGLPVSSLKADPDAKDPSEVVPKVFENVTVIEKLGSTLDGSLTFRDEDGTPVTLAQLVDGSTPVIFTLNYFSCETLCSIQLQGFTNGLRGMADSRLADLRVVTVSFDSRDTPELARAKRDATLASFEGSKPKWSFLTGSKENVEALAAALGFQYRYDEKTDQFAHTAAVFFVSPTKVVARYLYGIEYSARDIRFAWIDASEGKLGSTAERILLNCFHYDEASGKYTPFAFKVVRIGGIVTVSFLGLMLGALWRKEKRRLAGGFERAA